MLQFAISLVFQEMIALTCHIKTRFLEITDRKDRGKYYSDLRFLECSKKGLKKYVDKKVKSRNEINESYLANFVNDIYN